MVFALAGVGLNTNLSIFKGIRFKPFILGFAAAIIVGITSILLNVIIMGL